LKGLAAVSSPRRYFQKDSGTVKKIPELSISNVFIVRKFEVSGADYAATLRGGRIRNATSLSLPRSHCRARFIVGLKSKTLPQRQTRDTNNRAGKQEPAF
jgi:hypothetical protein